MSSRIELQLARQLGAGCVPFASSDQDKLDHDSSFTYDKTTGLRVATTGRFVATTVAVEQPTIYVREKTSAGYGVGIAFEHIDSGDSSILVAAKITADGDASWNGAGNRITSLRFFTMNAGTLAERMRISGGGILLIGTTVTTNGAAGHIIVANSASLRGVNVAGNDTLSMVVLDSSNNVRVGNNATSVIVIGGPGSVTGATAGDLVVANAKNLRFCNNAGNSTANYGVRSTAGDELYLDVPAAGGFFGLSWAGTRKLTFQNQNSGPGILFETESSADHPAPSANCAVIYTKDNGAGKTQLVVRFNTGAVQVLATEP